MNPTAFKRVVLLAGIALLFLPALTLAAFCCPFCINQGQTLTMETNQASFVIFGTPTNARASLNDLDSGTTDIVIEEVIRPHDFIKGKKVVTIPRYLPVGPNSTKFVVFCDVFKDRVDPYRGFPVKDKEIVTYLKGAFAVKDKDMAERLAFFFSYLDHADTEVSGDAYKEFANADAKDVIRMMEKADKAKMTAKLVQWLRDDKTPSYRYGLYGYLLGSCGTEQHAPVLQELLSDPQRGLVSGIDGVLAGYVLLRPKEGWAYLRTVLGDESKDFTRRYAALRAVRFFWDTRADVIAEKDLVSATTLLLSSELADLAIDELRKRKQWHLADTILGLWDKHNVPIIRRAILRFALSCPPGNKKVEAFLKEQRQKDPERVKDVEELLKLEQPLTKRTDTPWPGRVDGCRSATPYGS